MKNNTKKILSMLLAILMMASMSVTALATDGDFTGNKSTVNYDFNYTVTKEDVYTDVSGVKLTWSVPVVKYVDTTVTTWNTDTLKWEQTNPTKTENKEVSFTLTNRGSYAVIASASFALEDSLKKTGEETKDAASVSFTGNDATLNSIVDATTKAKKNAGTETSDEDYLTANCSAIIKGTVSIDNADKLTATSGKLGTYTVSIRNTVHTVTVSYFDYATGEDVTKTIENVAKGTKIVLSEEKTSADNVYTGGKTDVYSYTIAIGDNTFTDKENQYLLETFVNDVGLDSYENYLGSGKVDHWEYSTDGGTSYQTLTNDTTVTGNMIIKPVHLYTVEVDSYVGNGVFKEEYIQRVLEGTPVEVSNDGKTLTFLGKTYQASLDYDEYNARWSAPDVITGNTTIAGEAPM